jgi:hypothetical protein
MEAPKVFWRNSIVRMISSGYSFGLPLLLGFEHKFIRAYPLSLRYALTILSIFFGFSFFGLIEKEDRLS